MAFEARRTASTPRVEPETMLNYGNSTPAITVITHVIYGAIVGEFMSIA
jgi:hypothetical protein